MTDADRIADLQERIAYLERELGLSLEQTRIARLIGYGMTRSQAHVVLALHQAAGRTLSADQLDDTLPRGERDARNFIKVITNRARAIVGADAIETVRGVGYRISGNGAARVERMLAV